VPGESGVEQASGSAHYHLHRPATSNTPLSATLSWAVARDAVMTAAEELSQEQQTQFLAPNALVLVGREILQPILDEIYAMRKDDSPAATAGAISGYHCWVQFYLPERGWVPIDASSTSAHSIMLPNKTVERLLPFSSR
tara:strand:+ start:52863 stop:53279 length:417 start_codon:yes stop_codon:yes gene_type:complete